MSTRLGTSTVEALRDDKPKKTGYSTSRNRHPTSRNPQLTSQTRHWTSRVETRRHDTTSQIFCPWFHFIQEQEGTERVIGYFGRTLTKAERNYCVTCKELLAVVAAVEHFNYFLYGRPFIIRTDHSALQWMMDFRNVQGQSAHWLEKFQQYDFSIVHRQGVKHGNADALSKRPCAEHDSVWRRKKLECSEKTKVLDLCWDGLKRVWYNRTGLLWHLAVKWQLAQWDSLRLCEGCLYHEWEDVTGESNRLQLIVLKVLQSDILKQLPGNKNSRSLWGE